MALINHAKKEINAKIVYAGPGGAGKESSLQFIYRKLKTEFRSPLKSARLQDDSMLFFDFMPPSEGSVQGYSVRFHLYTLPGELTDTVSWKMLLKGVDGIVFVADLTADRLGQDRASLDQLQELLGGYQKGVSSLPFVVQANKRDCAEAVSLDELCQTIGRADLPLVPASALNGEGVLESLFQVVKAILKELRSSGLSLGTPPERIDSTAVPIKDEAPASPPANAPAVEPAAGEPLPEITSAGGPLMEGATALPAERRTEATAPLDVLSAAAALVAQQSPVSGDKGITVSFAAAPSLLSGSQVAIPLLVAVGEREEQITLTISLAGRP